MKGLKEKVLRSNCRLFLFVLLTAMILVLNGGELFAASSDGIYNLYDSTHNLMFVGTEKNSTQGDPSDYCPDPSKSCALTPNDNKSAYDISNTQFSYCVQNLFPMSATFGTWGGTGSITVIVNSSTCQWSVRTDESWITITSGSSGIGNGTVTYSVLENRSSRRIGYIKIESKNFTVEQDGITPQYTLSVSKTGNGTVTSNPSGINCGSTCSASFNSGTNVTLTATPDSGSTFSSWSGDCSGASSTCTVMMDSAKNVTATFNACTYSINPMSTSVGASATTGSITVTASPSNCSWTATSNESWITITSGSSGAGNGTVTYSISENTSTSSRTGTITIAGQRFTIAQGGAVQYTLSVNKTGTGTGTVTSNPAGINCGSACSASFLSGTSVTLNASAASNSIFKGWSGDCTGSSTTCTVNMDAAKNVTATFDIGTTQCTYTISVARQTFSSSAGTGTVTLTPSVPNCIADWNLTSNSSWLNFTYTCGTGTCTSSTANGRSGGSVSFRLDANSSSSQRTGMITLTGGSNVTITQVSGGRGSCTQCGISFNDVPTTSYAYNNILAIGCAGLTQGCGTNQYCTYENVTRGQMAAFIVRAKEGEPPSDYCSSGSGFNDVSISDVFCKYIKRLSELQITTGCGNGNYCPSDNVTRGQMAAFIIRALYGESFTYTQTPYFSDVPSSHSFFKYVQKMKDDGLTTVTGLYDVDSLVTREQMAAFLYRAFLFLRCEGGVCNNAGVTARVMNATTGQGISGATVEIGGHRATTDGNGNATISGLSASSSSGSQNTATVQVSATGYASQNTILNLVCGQTLTRSVSLLPEDSGSARGDVRIVLTWGENPSDLDGHLTGPKTDGSTTRFHVYWLSNNMCSNSPCSNVIPAMYNVDTRTGYGPETITILSTNGVLTPGLYRYSVHHYSGTGDIPNSGAEVRVYRGTTLLGRYTPPPAGSGQTIGSGWIWTVFEMTVDSSGSVSFSTINTYNNTGSYNILSPNRGAGTDYGDVVEREERGEDIGIFIGLPEK